MVDAPLPIPGAVQRDRRAGVGYTMALCGAALFAVNGTVSKIALTGSDLDAVDYTQLRTAGGFVGLFLLLAVFARDRLRIARHDIPFLAFYGMFSFALVQWLYFIAIEHLPIGIYALPEISAIGAPEHELTQNKIPYETGIARYREIARGQILGDDSGFLKLLVHREDQRLLGVHAVGTGATELIHIGQAVLELGGGLQYFLRTVFNYPTLAECYKVAALNALNKLSP